MVRFRRRPRICWRESRNITPLLMRRPMQIIQPKISHAFNNVPGCDTCVSERLRLDGE